MQEDQIDVCGQQLRIMEGGQGDPLVFLHGADGPAWSPLLELLSQTWRVIAPEHPGFGRSEIPGWMTSVGDLAFFYLDVLAALRLEKVNLVGRGIGGWIAAELGIRNTSPLNTLTLIAPAGVADPDSPFPDIFLWSPEETARRSVQDSSISQALLRDIAGAGVDVALRNRAAAARLAWNPRLHNPQLSHWLHRINAPTLLIWGKDDQIIPHSCHAYYMAAIDQAELLTFADVGHRPDLERPTEVAEKLFSFCSGARS
jgi:pimeloyl-ACP methyl ester carboxylesterase